VHMGLGEEEMWGCGLLFLGLWGSGFWDLMIRARSVVIEGLWLRRRGVQDYFGGDVVGFRVGGLRLGVRCWCPGFGYRRRADHSNT
jgi:hypothetical protein